MRTNPSALLKQLALGGTLAVASTSAFAANQGALSSTSTGDLDITLTVNDVVQISNLADITLNFTGGDVTGNSPACVFRNGGGDYDITATGSGAGGAFTIANGADTIAYSVDYNSTELTSGTTLTGVSGAVSDLNCTTSGNNGSIDVDIAAADAAAVGSGSYTGTLTLVVAPN